MNTFLQIGARRKKWEARRRDTRDRR